MLLLILRKKEQPGDKKHCGCEIGPTNLTAKRKVTHVVTFINDYGTEMGKEAREEAVLEGIQQRRRGQYEQLKVLQH